MMADMQPEMLPKVRNALQLMADGDFLAADPNEQLGRLVAILIIHSRGHQNDTCDTCGHPHPCPTVRALLYGGPQGPAS